MKNNRRKQVVLLFTVVVVALLAAVASGNVAHAGKNNPPVLPPHANAFGKTYGELAAQWWQWALPLLADENHPLLAHGAMDCSIGQEGKVWFLGGAPLDPSAGSVKIVLKCEVPTGKALFFPVVNIMCSELWGEGTTWEELSGCTGFVVDTFVPVEDLSVTIDGVLFDSPEVVEYRVVSPLFTVDPLPDPNILGDYLVGQGGLAVSEGYHFLLPPMSEGKHTIAFTGAIEVPEAWRVDYDVRYNLTVVGD